MALTSCSPPKVENPIAKGTQSLERRTAGCVLFVTCYLLHAKPVRDERRGRAVKILYYLVLPLQTRPALRTQNT